MGRLFSCSLYQAGKKKNGSQRCRRFPSSFSFLQIHHIMCARYDTSTMWVRSGHELGTISRIQDNTGCRYPASIYLVSCWCTIGVHQVFGWCAVGVTGCFKVGKHDPQDSESRRSHFYVYSISWVNTDMQLTSY